MYFCRFLAKNNKQTKVKLLTKFGAKWGYNRYDSLMNRMPYLGDAKYKAGLLTTSSSEHYAWYGTLVSGNTQYRPAPYINYHALNPGVIWYWVSEDDCLADRKPGKGVSATRKTYFSYLSYDHLIHVT